jgi:membrane protein DedA with SNARE-associated domain
MSGYTRKLFAPLNLFGAVTWVMVIGLAGYGLKRRGKQPPVKI